MSGPQATRGVLLLADISGYTGFLQAVANAHGAEMATMTELPAAYPLITTLLDGIVTRLVPPFRLSKLEGDAVFAYAPEESFEFRGDSVVDVMRQCYTAFQDRRDEAVRLMFCDCAACHGLQTLDLKFVLHWGTYVVQSIAGHEELLGPDVTMAHKLLKNNVSGVVGCSAYVLVTQPATEQLEVPRHESVTHTETFPHYPPMESNIFAFS